MLKSFKKGFTLIELLVVIAIIGILAGVVVFTTSGAATRAKNAALKSDAAAFLSAAIACTTDSTLANTGTKLATENFCTDSTSYPGKWLKTSNGVPIDYTATASGISAITFTVGSTGLTAPTCNVATGSCQ